MLLAYDAAYSHALAQPLAAQIVKLAGNYDAIVAPSTTTGKNVLPRVAALLDVMYVLDVSGIVSPETFERPVYAGNAIQTVQADAKKLLTIRTASLQAAVAGGSAAVEAVSAAENPGTSSFKGQEVAKSDRPELASAKSIISGGRALGSAEASGKVIEPVAHKLGAAMGASRAALDAGYAPTTGRSARPTRSALLNSISRSASPMRSSISPA